MFRLAALAGRAVGRLAAALRRGDGLCRRDRDRRPDLRSPRRLRRGRSGPLITEPGAGFRAVYRLIKPPGTALT